MIPLMSVTRNFFMGREPTKGRFIKRFDLETANRIKMEKMRQMGINLRAPDQAVGTLSGGETPDGRHRAGRPFRCQGADPGRTDQRLGVRQTSNVMATIARVRAQGVGRGLHQPQRAPRAGGGRPLHGAEPGPDPGEPPTRARSTPPNCRT